jgi:fatty acid amide hydrolase 2
MRALDPLLVGKSATQLAKLIRQGDVRCLDLVSVSIEHLRRTQATLNGLAGDDSSMLAQFERAKADAAHADELVARARASGRLSDLPPYLGVPICVKECFEVPGQPFTAGLVARRHCVGKKWATALERANSRLGCIVVGVTNTSEACMWFEACKSTSPPGA